MESLTLRWIGVLTILVLVYVIFRNADQFKAFINSLTAGFGGTIVALQGGDPTRFPVR